MSASEIWLIQLLSKVEINIPQLWEQGVPGSVRMLENLKDYYSKSDGATKKKILGCIFSEKLVLEKVYDLCGTESVLVISCKIQSR